MELSQTQISLAIQGFLDAQFNKKTDKEQKQLLKAKENNDIAKIAELEAFLKEEKKNYSPEQWFRKSLKMAEQLRFGTHTSKGIHSDAKGDNIIFRGETDDSIVGTHTVKSHLLDANGNAAALPLAAFFEYPVTPEYTMRDVILSQHKHLKFSSDEQLSKKYQKAFFQCLSAGVKAPTTHERNKQILWPIQAENNQYHVLVPLYPSVLAHEFFANINERKWGDEVKKARETRKKATQDPVAYHDLLDLASVQLGGTKPQNISLLNSRQGGRQYLLPSLPPIFKARSFSLSKKDDKLFSSLSYNYRVRWEINELIEVMKNPSNNVRLRDYRDDLIARILRKTFDIAIGLQQQAAGWSQAYPNLELEYKIWLDPNRDDARFVQRKEQMHWQEKIMRDFASWLQSTLQKQLKFHYKRKKESLEPQTQDSNAVSTSQEREFASQNNIQKTSSMEKRIKETDFGDAEFSYWKKAIREAVEASKRLGEGVFND